MKDYITPINKRVKILIVDDEYEFFETPLRIAIQMAFSQASLFWASSSEIALSYLESEEIDIILLDISLSGEEDTEGKHILKFIRDNQLHIPVIIFTKHREIKVIKDMILKWELGADSFIQKKEIIDTNNYLPLISEMVKLLYKYTKIYNKIGVLITHGTDTMAYGFSVLKYMLKTYNINIAMTGSQIPLSGYFSVSDAIGNLRRSLFVLNRFKPPSLSFIFNDGEKVFDGNLRKTRKFDIDGFEGSVVLGSRWWDEELHTSTSLVSYKDQMLERLYILRTGGTIESEEDPVTGALVPTGDFVTTYITSSLQKEFISGDVLTPYPSIKKDSSCLNIETWSEIGNNILRILNDENLPGEIDTKFDQSVKPILLNPFFTQEDYNSQIESCSGIIILGYGAGNGNIEEDNYSFLEVVKKCIDQGKIFIMCSQVPINEYDFCYEVGRKFIEAGVIPSGNLSHEESQIRLSYILGHEDIIRNKAKVSGVDYLLLIKALFLCGVHFKTNEKKKEIEKILRLKLCSQDLLSNHFYNFEDVIEQIVHQYKKNE